MNAVQTEPCQFALIGVAMTPHPGLATGQEPKSFLYCHNNNALSDAKRRQNTTFCFGIRRGFTFNLILWAWLAAAGRSLFDVDVDR